MVPAGPLDEDSRLLAGSITDGSLFTEFYRRNRDPLLAWLYRRTTSAEVAADLAAESFAVALAKRRVFEPERGSARAWLWGIAAIELQRWWRKGEVDSRVRRRLGITVQAVDDEAIEHVESLIDIAEIALTVREQLGLLPTGERSAVQLRVLDELTYEEVAGRLGCTPGAARTRVSRGLSRLRRQLALDPTDPGST